MTKDKTDESSNSTKHVTNKNSAIRYGIRSCSIVNFAILAVLKQFKRKTGKNGRI